MQNCNGMTCFQGIIVRVIAFFLTLQTTAADVFFLFVVKFSSKEHR